MEHEYKIQGSLNNIPIIGNGRGRIDLSKGTSELEVKFDSLPADGILEL